MSAADKIDNSPLFQMLTKVIMEGPDALIKGIGESLAGAGVSGGSHDGASHSNSSGVFQAVKQMLSGTDDKPVASAAPTQEPTMAIATPAVSVDRFHVDAADLGSFSAPTFGAGSARGGAGVSV